jgi:hypothetical protein
VSPQLDRQPGPPEAIPLLRRADWVIARRVGAEGGDEFGAGRFTRAIAAWDS